MQSFPKRTAELALVISIAIVTAVQLYVWDHITDDAYISFRYAARLSSGDGLTFNANERVEGFSNPSWTLLLGGLHFLTGLDLQGIARVLGLLSTVAILFCMFFAGRTEAVGLVFSFALLLLHPGFHTYATAGLEGSLFSLLLTFAFVATIEQTTRGRAMTAFALGLAGITRPEGVMYGILWLLFSFSRANSLADTWRREWKSFMLVFLPAIAWQVFRLAYFGAWVPNTAIAKLPGTFGAWMLIPLYLQPAIIMFGGPLVVLGFLLARVRAENILLHSSVRVALPFTLAALIFIVYAQGDWMPFQRFVVPVLPIVAFVFGNWIVDVIEQLQVSNALRATRFLPYLAMFGLVSCSVFAWQSQVRAYVRNEGVNMLMRGDDQVKVGEWLHDHIKPGSTVATGRLGGIGFAAPELVILDLNGLTDIEEAKFVARGRSPNPSDDPILQRNPDVIAAIDVPFSWGYKQDSSFVNWLTPKYQFVRSFPQGKFGAIDIWISRRAMSTVLREE